MSAGPCAGAARWSPAGERKGRATAWLFAREGAIVALTDIDAQGAEEVAQAIREEGHDARAWTLDAGDRNVVHTPVPQIAQALGGLDIVNNAGIVVNNAGISARVTFDDPDYDSHWDRNIAITLTGQQAAIRAAIPFLSDSDAPRIMNIAATEALGARAGCSAHSAAEAGVTGLTRSFAVEYGRRGITVTACVPAPSCWDERPSKRRGPRNLRPAAHRAAPPWRLRGNRLDCAESRTARRILDHRRDHPGGWRAFDACRETGRPSGLQI